MIKRLAGVTALILTFAACSPQTTDTTGEDEPQTGAGIEEVGGEDPSRGAEPGVKITMAEPDANGVVVVTVDVQSLSGPIVFLRPAQGSDDPFFHIHTDGDQDPDLFLGLELFTVYGSAWTGQTGTFPPNCTSHGICGYLDVDGKGPIEVSAPANGGDVQIDKLNGGYDVTLRNVTFPSKDGRMTYLLNEIQLTG